MIILNRILKSSPLLELTGSEYINHDKVGRLKPSTRDEFINRVKQANILLIHDSLLDPANRKEFIQNPAPPFPVCWVELLGKPGHMAVVLFDIATDIATLNKYFPGELWRPGEKVRAGSPAMLFVEKSPNIYDLFCTELFTSENKDFNYGMTITVIRNVDLNRPEDDDYHHGIRHLVASARVMLAMIESGVMGVEEGENSILIPRNNDGKAKGKLRVKPHTVRRLIHVAPKSQREAVRPTQSSRQINWSHRWEVRGHWRKVDALGKDRSGEYIIPGFTWVKESIKGDESLPLIKKTRIFKGNAE